MEGVILMGHKLALDKDAQEKILSFSIRFEEDVKWFYGNYEELKSKYPNELVAVFQKSVVGHHKDIKELRTILEEEFSEEDILHMPIEYVSTRKIKTIL
jgi:hypothetical protein